jgi:hypothetical protein
MGGSLQPATNGEGLGEFRHAEKKTQQYWENQSRFD